MWFGLLLQNVWRRTVKSAVINQTSVSNAKLATKRTRREYVVCFMWYVTTGIAIYTKLFPFDGIEAVEPIITICWSCKRGFLQFVRDCNWVGCSAVVMFGSVSYKAGIANIRIALSKYLLCNVFFSSVYCEQLPKMQCHTKQMHQMQVWLQEEQKRTML